MNIVCWLLIFSMSMASYHTAYSSCCCWCFKKKPRPAAAGSAAAADNPLHKAMREATSIAMSIGTLEERLLAIEEENPVTTLAAAIAFFFNGNITHPRAQYYNLHNVLEGSDVNNIRLDFSQLTAPAYARSNCIDLILNLLLSYFSPTALYLKHLAPCRPILTSHSLTTIAIYLAKDEEPLPIDDIESDPGLVLLQTTDYASLTKFLRMHKTPFTA